MENNQVIFTQHRDKTITQKAYQQFGKDILITSFFRTIQGEGPLTGHPAIFLRLAGCNFGNKTSFCKFCDTSFEFDKGKPYEVTKLLNSLLEIPGYIPSDILVITGGEPTLQQNLIELTKLAADKFADIQIETNGTQPSFFKKLAEHACKIKVVVSPKISYREKRYSILSDTVLSNATCLKFIIADDGIHNSIPDWAFEKQKQYKYQIYVSPMTVYKKEYDGEVSSIWDSSLVDQELTSRNYSYAAQFALANNCLLSLQTHLFTSIP